VLVAAVVVLAYHGPPGMSGGRVGGAVSMAEKSKGGGKAKLPGNVESPCSSKDLTSNCKVLMEDVAEVAGAEADWQSEVKKLESQAETQKKEAEKEMEAAKAEEEKAQKKVDDAGAVKDDAAARLKGAKDLAEQAASMRAQAKQALKDADNLEKGAKEATKEAASLEEQAKGREAEASEIEKKAAQLKKKADDEWKKADDVKEKARKELEKHRECLDLPGIRLSKGENEILAAEGDDAIWNAELCRHRCLENTECQQMVWVGWKNGCYLYGDRVADAVEFKDTFNSSYCGFRSEEDALKEILDTTYKQVPYNPPIKECSWSGEDCAATYCCNDVSCDKDFSNCRGYTCYKQDEYFAGCLLDPSPDAGWSNEIIGGPRETREVQPADEGVKVQGTSLFCFSVINWDAPAPKPFWATERELATHIKDHQLSIFQCDEGDFFSGYQTPKAEWGSFSNIDAFVAVWGDVKNDGRWMNHDWIVKVDADAVFFPHRLKDHLTKLRPPKNSRVYIKNVNYQFQFMGALEVISKEGLELYFEKGSTCIRGEHDGGEDFFMKGCLDAIGVDHMVDFELLQDKYCLTCADRDNGCTDGWHVAYHFHKKMISWDWCYNQAVCGDKAGSCDEGLKVEYVMPDA